MTTNSTKYNARLLADLLKKHGCENLIFSPGSRNAPIIVALGAHKDYKTYSVPDERAAAFTALGMALQNGKPAAVVCTSGSAVANYLPAVTEAFYQKVPLIIISADRPLEKINQGHGQTIDQRNLFGKHILKEANLLGEPSDELTKAYNQRVLNDALSQAHKGPVHINIPFEEPLYDVCKIKDELFQFFANSEVHKTIAIKELEKLTDIWNSSTKIMVLMGQMQTNSDLESALDILNSKSAFLPFSETLSNINCEYNVTCIDRLLNTISLREKEDLKPDLLITIGGEVVSKMVKKFLSDTKPLIHWHVSESEEAKDTFGALRKVVNISPQTVFEQLLPLVKVKDETWRNKWYRLHKSRNKAHEDYIKKAPFSDFKVFAHLKNYLPKNSILHCANSASIRYSQLFEHDSSIEHFANRGTSGIDGSTSTAVGHALKTKKIVTLVTGDIAFVYDSAAFWNDRLPGNLKIIVLNNSGGNIFRIIKGPQEIEHFERFQETHHNLNLAGIASLFNLSFDQATEANLSEKLEDLYSENGLKILEVKTPRIDSPKVLTEYFNTLKD